MSEAEFEALLERHHEFDQRIRRALTTHTYPVPTTVRTNASWGLCKIALQHGAGFRVLFANQLPASAFALVRLQFEAALRASWLMFAAEEAWVVRFGSPVDETVLTEPEKFPHVYQMLSDLEASQSTPVNLHLSLSTLKNKSWETLNSYTHGGLRSISRVLDGFEFDIKVWMLRTSSSLCYLTVQLCAAIVSAPEASYRIEAVRQAYPDCMHS